MIAGVTLPAGGSAFDRNGPSTLRALAHAPISSALSPNRYRTNPSSNRALKGLLRYLARPKGRDEPFTPRALAEPALQRTDNRPIGTQPPQTKGAARGLPPTAPFLLHPPTP